MDDFSANVYEDYLVDGEAIFDGEGRPHLKVQLVAKRVLYR